MAQLVNANNSSSPVLLENTSCRRDGWLQVDLFAPFAWQKGLLHSFISHLHVAAIPWLHAWCGCQHGLLSLLQTTWLKAEPIAGYHYSIAHAGLLCCTGLYGLPGDASDGQAAQSGLVSN